MPDPSAFAVENRSIRPQLAEAGQAEAACPVFGLPLFAAIKLAVDINEAVSGDVPLLEEAHNAVRMYMSDQTGRLRIRS